MKIISFAWFVSILALLVTDVRTGVSQQKDVAPQRCYRCPRTNETSECLQLEDLSQITCLPELPYCATTAKTPEFISKLTCAAKSRTPCMLKQTSKDIYEVTCICTGPLCNAPFTQDLRNELLNVSFINLPDNRTRGLMEVFINSTMFRNLTEANLYESLTQAMIREKKKLPEPSTPIQTSSLKPNLNLFEEANAPRAEALKHETTLPSDDDEDESEGSGSFEEVKPQVPAAPAAPSSFLPANENKATHVHTDILVTIPFITLYTVM